MKPIDTLRTVGRPIAFYPALSKHVGGTKPCLFLCQLMYWSDRTDNKLGVYKSSEQWEEETGLSYKEQATARKELVKRGLITETNKRLEHRIYFLFNESEFNNLILAISSMGNSRNADRAVGEDTNGHFDPTENTTEITSESIQSTGVDLAHDAGDQDIEAAQAESSQEKPATAQQVIDAYNEILGDKLPACKVINAKRKREIKKFLGSLKAPTLKAVNAYLHRFAKLARPFHMGDNDRGWKANFDYVIRENTVTNVREETL